VANGLPATSNDQEPELQDVLKKVTARKRQSEAARRPYIKRWREWYGLHRNYRRFARAHSSAGTESDRDEVVRGAQREFGAELFIPYAFTVIESTVPRVLMNNPSMKVKPRPGLSPEAAMAVKQMYEERQTDIDYSLKLLPSARRGLKYGLGVGKSYWEREGRNQPVLERTMMPRRLAARLMGAPEPSNTEFVVTSEGPMIEDVELEDFFWDSAAKDMKTSRYAIHRTWRDLQYIKERIERNEWLPVDLDSVKSMGPAEGRNEMLTDRARASGLDDFNTNELSKLYEIWEYHDGEMVHTILNGQLVVQSKPSPWTHRQLPFQIYRPTLQEGEFVGIGEIEPIVHLQYELNTLRSQRRDNATLVLQKAFMYAEGLVDPADLVVGPGKGIPVYGNPNEVIVPLNFGDIPASSVSEETALKADIELATGMSDTAAGGSGVNNASATTATGIQLVQAASNVRVSMKTKLLSAEYIKPQASQWLELWRQNAAEKPMQVAVESTNSPTGYQFITVRPEDLDKVQAILPEEDSTQPDNAPQKRNDALALYNQTRGNQVLDQRAAALHLLRAFDVPDAEGMILPEQTQMNPQVANVVGHVLMQNLVRAGMDPKEAETITLATMQQAMQSAGVSQPPADQTRHRIRTVAGRHAARSIRWLVEPLSPTAPSADRAQELLVLQCDARRTISASCPLPVITDAVP
jgi:hypothetical protein